MTDTVNSTDRSYDATPWYVRAALSAETRLRPYLGWGALLILALLASLPAFSLRVNNWVRLDGDQAVLEALGPLSVLTVWIVAGWRRPRGQGSHTWYAVLAMALLTLAVGFVMITQAAAGWIPGVREFISAVWTGSFGSLAEGMAADWERLGGRLGFWWTGVQAGTTTQDNLVFFVVAGSIVWLAGSLSAGLARRFGNGLMAAAPLLWLLATILLYSQEGRILFVFALGLAVLLHFLTDHEAMLARWERDGFDYSTGLFLDRLMLVLGASLFILTLAAVMPNLYVQAVVDRYYAQMQPAYEQLEDTADRLFPGVKGTSRFGSGLAGGLPNDFLLQAGPSLTDDVVMYVSTNDAPPIDYPYEPSSPPGHYMRGGTLSEYDGLGWRNPGGTDRQEVEANSSVVEAMDAGETLAIGRKEIVQQVAMVINTQVLYAAPEPAELSTVARVETRGPGDLIALWGREKTYTAVSRVPAVNDEALAAVSSWGSENPLPESYAIHLALPDTVTERTVELARELTNGKPSMYAKAQAIEGYLRTFEYDLTVSAPPADVVDVADYFLFELQRGYCDYYATAFVVIARSVGLPARFATGFAPGNWNPEDGRWTITEAEAHSWPEVYFPDYGWIPFEPTAGRPELARIGLPSFSSSGGAPAAPEAEEEPSETIDWNWQMLVWLLPIGLLAWGGWKLAQRIRRRREDPWQTLVRWGGRAGRPMASGETILEYGDGLADYVVGTQRERQDLARVAATEMRALSGAVSSGRYAPPSEREKAGASVAQHWERLRGYLRSLRRG